MACIEPVTDPHDPRIEPYRTIRERDLVGREGLFVAEGRVVLGKLAGAGLHPIRSLLIAKARQPSLQALLDALPADLPAYVAEQDVMDAVAGFPMHRGILAIGERRTMRAEALLAGLPSSALVVALSAIANHDNMGGIFRNAAAFGADAVLLDAACCDPLYRKSIRVSVGAALITPFARLPAEQDLLGVLATAGFETVALSPRGEVELADLACGPRTAAVFGAEGPGLDPHLLARSRSVRIGMAHGFDSLNVATTSGLVLYQLSKRRSFESSA